jgi:hypothetical protein
LELLLVNAGHGKILPGRKTDVGDAVWLAELLEHGLLRGALCPQPPIRELRDLTRYRKRLIQAMPRGPSGPEDLGGRGQQARLGRHRRAGRVGSGDAGRAGRRRTRPSVLAELAKGRLRAKLPQLCQALRGRFGAHHALLIRLALAHLEQLEAWIAELDTHLDRVLAPFAQARDRLATITGVGKPAAETIGAEIGTDMTVSPDRRAPGVVGGALPGQQPHRWQAPLGQAHQGQPLAGGGAHLGAPGRRRAAATATCRPSTGGSRAGLARRRPRSRSGTRSWSSPGTCSPTTATTRTWVATTSSGATPIASDNGPSSNSRPSATASSSNPLRRNTPRIHVSG